MRLAREISTDEQARTVATWRECVEPGESLYRLDRRGFVRARASGSKAETAKKYGEEQVHIWRRSYAVLPPALEKADPRYPGHELKYARVPKADLPVAESLQDTIDRFLPFWQDQVVPKVAQGERIIISAHGKTLRALVKYLDQVSDDRIPRLEIPTGILGLRVR